MATSHTVHVQVPATSANLGPGFDTFGLALAYGDDLWVTAEPAEPSRRSLIVETEGEGAGAVPLDDRNLVVRSIAHVYQAVGLSLPSLHLRAVNRIPHGRGMGSSAAAIVSGVMAAAALIEAAGTEPSITFTQDDLLRYATELEGHPDNVAPALFGGLTIAWTEDGTPKAKALAVHRGVSPLLLVPSFQVSTHLARSLQPAQVPHEDAVFNVSRSALLITSMTQSPELLFRATEDRLHQHYRSSAMPQTRDLISSLRERGHSAVVSGAGPSILVLSPSPDARLAADDFVAAQAPEWRRLSLAVDIEGATVEEVHSN